MNEERYAFPWLDEELFHAEVETWWDSVVTEHGGWYCDKHAHSKKDLNFFKIKKYFIYAMIKWTSIPKLRLSMPEADKLELRHMKYT